MDNKIKILFLSVILVSPVFANTQMENKIDEIINKMTLEEKVGQMAQVTIDILVDKKNWQLHDSLVKKGILDYKIGSVLNTWDNEARTPEVWNKYVSALQDYTQKTRMKIPIVYGVDAIHGVTYTAGATLFPQEIAMAATYNRKLVREAAEICAYETRTGSLPWTFSPVLDLGLDYRWPRIWEGFGEDPYLVSALGVEMVRGYQGEDKNKIDKYHIGACAKHYLGYSVPVSGKDRTPANIPENILREYHLPPFKAAVDAGMVSIMVNSGLINGEPVHASNSLITGLLKEELGFDGVVVSDWNDIENIWRRDKVATSLKDAVRLAINAGIDMSMIPYDYRFCDYLVQLVNEGAVPVSRVDDAVRRILRMKYRMGLFEKSYYPVSDYPKFASEANRSKALEIATEAMTLLKNRNGVLPLKKGSKVLVCGPNANSMRSLNGGWSYSWLGEKTEKFAGKYNTILEAIINENGADNVKYSQGVQYVETGKYWEEKECDINDAVSKAKESDFILLCLGENSYTEKPGDLQDMYLSDLQTKLAMAMASTGKPVILILNEGRPRIINRFEDKMSVVLMTYLPGNFGGDAIGDVIFGDSNPSGKLPFNYPRYPQSLINYFHKYSEEQVRNQGVYNYESDYSTQYEFGTGLSYTSFSYSNLNLSKSEIGPDEQLKVSIDITNTGKVKGKESVLLYLSDLYASIAPDMKRLKGFDKIELNPGETKTIEFVLKTEDLSFVDLKNRTVAEAGEFAVTVGRLRKTFNLKEGKILRQSTCCNTER